METIVNVNKTKYEPPDEFEPGRYYEKMATGTVYLCTNNLSFVAISAAFSGRVKEFRHAAIQDYRLFDGEITIKQMRR